MNQSRIILEDWTPFASGLQIDFSYDAGRLREVVGFRNGEILSNASFEYDEANHVVAINVFSNRFHMALDHQRHFTAGSAKFVYDWDDNHIVASEGRMDVVPLGSVTGKEPNRYEFNRRFAYDNKGRLMTATQEDEVAYTMRRKGDIVVESENGAESTYFHGDGLLREIREVVKGRLHNRVLFEYLDDRRLARVLEERAGSHCRILQIHHYGLVGSFSIIDNIAHHFWVEQNGQWLLTGKLHAPLGPSEGDPVEMPIVDVDDSLDVIERQCPDIEFYRLDPQARIANGFIRSSGKCYLRQKAQWGEGERWRLDKIVNHAEAYGWGLVRQGIAPVFMDDYVHSWAPWQEVVDMDK